jgi:hypothetical protein
MEPKHSMSAYAVASVIALTLLSLMGLTRTAMWTSLGLLAAAAALAAESARLLTNGRRLERVSPPHRQRLDRLVLGQWIGAGLGGLAVGLACAHFDLKPLDNCSSLVGALIIGALVGVLGVFLSSLVDWYVILPKVSGLAGPAPCEKSEGEMWKYTTCFWFFHRAMATALVYLVLVGIPTYMGNISSGSALVAWAVVATLIALVAGYFCRGMFLAFWFAFNPPLLVGDNVLVNVAEEGDWDVRLKQHRAYVVDLSLQGAKYKILDEGRYVRGRFLSKDDGQIPIQLLGAAKAPRTSKPAPCAGACSGVNWYCRHNPEAHS